MCHVTIRSTIPRDLWSELYSGYGYKSIVSPYVVNDHWLCVHNDGTLLLSIVFSGHIPRRTLEEEYEQVPSLLLYNYPFMYPLSISLISRWSTFNWLHDVSIFCSFGLTSLFVLVATWLFLLSEEEPRLRVCLALIRQVQSLHVKLHSSVWSVYLW